MSKLSTYVINQHGTLQQSLNLISQLLSNRQVSKEDRGELAELGVYYILLALQSTYPNFTIYHSVLLKVGNNYTTEIDFVVVTPYKVIVLECKSFYGQITVTPDNLFTIKAGKQTYTHNVLYQNQGHCKAIYSTIYQRIKGASTILPIITLFSNSMLQDKRNINIQQQFPILTIIELFDYISATLYPYYSTGQPNTVDYSEVVRLLDQHNIQSEDAMLAHIKRVKAMRRR